VAYYKVALSTDGGVTWPAAGTGNDLTPNGIYDPSARSFTWTIGGSLNTTQARIRVRALASDSTVLAETVEPGNFTISPSGGGTVELSGVPYIHQYYDTADDFTGGYDCCNATAALMAIQYYGKLPVNPITCTRGGSHTSSYGFYISSIYSFNGHTYNIPSSAVWGSSDAGYYGGFGYFLQDAAGDSLPDILALILSAKRSQVT
jgi:hypothetical protein